jgi:hypothetical protein
MAILTQCHEVLWRVVHAIAVEMRCLKIHNAPRYRVNTAMLDTAILALPFRLVEAHSTGKSRPIMGVIALEHTYLPASGFRFAHTPHELPFFAQCLQYWHVLQAVHEAEPVHLP